MAALSNSSLTAATTNGSHPSSPSLVVQPAGSRASSPSLLTAPGASHAQALLADAATDRDAELRSGRSDELDGMVAFQKRHVFLCYKRPEGWPSDVEATESDRFPRLLAAAIKARQSEFSTSTALTICEGRCGRNSSIGDMLVFPDMVRYSGLSYIDVDNFVEEVLVKDVEWLPGSPEAISGSYVFVYAHGCRDKRCGACAPDLIKRFSEEIEGQGLDGKVAVRACSHVGGHKYAGNVIIFSVDAKGEVTGHWYGYVTPDDVPVLLEKHIGEGEIVSRLWRGQMGVPEGQHNTDLISAHERGVLKGKLLTPAGFNDGALLQQSETHGFKTGKQLCEAINKSDTFLSTKMAACLLANGDLFAVPLKDLSEDASHKNEAVRVLVNAEIGLIKPRGDLYTSRTLVKPLQERKAETAPIGGMTILRRDLGGNRCLRRRFSFEDNENYHVLQWLLQEPNEKPVRCSKKTDAQNDEQNDGLTIGSSIKALEKMTELTPSEKGKAIMVLKDEENRVIFASTSDAEVRKYWLLEEIRKMRMLERGKGSDP